MTEHPFYQVSVDDQEIIIKLNKELVDKATLENILDYLKLESIRQKSQLTEEQAAILADEIDQAVWVKLKPKFFGQL